jgi:hypothetical protein
VQSQADRMTLTVDLVKLSLVQVADVSLLSREWRLKIKTPKQREQGRARERREKGRTRKIKHSGYSELCLMTSPMPEQELFNRDSF